MAQQNLWYVTENGQQLGPFSAEQLKEMAAKGELVATDMVWTEGWNEWRPVSSTTLGTQLAQRPPGSPPPPPPPCPPATTITTTAQQLAPHRGVMILIFGIVSLIPCFGIVGLVFGGLAWFLGNADLEAMRAGRMNPEGEGQTRTGQICGMIGAILGVVQLVLLCGYMILAAGVLSSLSRF